MATRYWVGGGSSANWNATGPTNWGTASNTQDDASVPGASDDVIFDGVGTGASNSTLSADITINSLDMTGYVNMLTHNSGVTLTHDSGGVFTFAAGMTYTLGSPTTASLGFTGTSGTTTITAAGKTVGTIIFNGAGGTFQLQDTLTTSGSITRSAGTFDANSQTVVLAGTTPSLFGSFTGTSSFANLTRTGTAAKTDTLSMNNSVTVTGTLTINGNSSTNRVLVQSSTLGTARTITAATVSVTNADFRDITGAGAGSWNLSAITGLSGDCGGNSGITFTTGATQYWVGGTGNWSTAAEWGTSSGGSGGRVPLPQDDVVFDANSFSAGSQTATLDMPRAGKSIDWTGVTNTPAWAKTTTTTIYGSVTMVSGMTNSGTTVFIFEGRGSFTLTSAGQAWSNPFSIQMVAGTLTLQDALTVNSSANTSLFNGTFNANNFNVSVPVFIITGSATRTLTMGSGTWTISGTATVWSAATITGLTFNKDTSTIVVSNTTATAKTFAGGGLIYNNVTFSGDNITVTGSNTFATMAVNNAGLTNGLKLTDGTTQTVTGFTTNGSVGNLAKLLSTAGAAATISKSSGTVSIDYMSIEDSTATGGATWYAGANSTNVGGNTGWIFTAPPSGTAVKDMIDADGIVAWAR